ncbi:hypothetical protein EVAR_38702_1 [Eumeta japonica]|uniref:Uncharacterized protein n=1 Tax=Eumeta variegata TaxID=151549 RepID=A0A4C1XPT4_EUMVA|nr:hypothetical protein EVAR_38702_1 [Eumeta japonica]
MFGIKPIICVPGETNNLTRNNSRETNTKEKTKRVALNRQHIPYNPLARHQCFVDCISTPLIECSRLANSALSDLEWHKTYNVILLLVQESLGTPQRKIVNRAKRRGMSISNNSIQKEKRVLLRTTSSTQSKRGHLDANCTLRAGARLASNGPARSDNEQTLYKYVHSLVQLRHTTLLIATLLRPRGTVSAALQVIASGHVYDSESPHVILPVGGPPTKWESERTY